DDVGGEITSKENDTMANWDDAQLAEVVEKRHGEDNRKKNATQIVCFHHYEMYFHY
ncbi:unnamed protein product, partial [Adineta steineri]